MSTDYTFSCCNGSATCSCEAQLDQNIIDALTLSNCGDAPSGNNYFITLDCLESLTCGDAVTITNHIITLDCLNAYLCDDIVLSDTNNLISTSCLNDLTCNALPISDTNMLISEACLDDLVCGPNPISPTNLLVTEECLSALNVCIVSQDDSASVGCDKTGNTRGSYAIDFQNTRILPTSVASGNRSVIVGSDSRATGIGAIVLGHNNIADGNYSASLFGTANTIDSLSQYCLANGLSADILNSTYCNINGGTANSINSSASSTISGGQSNDINNGNYNAVGGGLTNLIANSESSFIGGGQGNQILGGVHNAISGGNSNTISSTSNNNNISGGQSNTIFGSAIHSGLLAGNNLLLSGDGSIIIGGQTNQIDGDRSAIISGNMNTIDENSLDSTIISGVSNNVVAGIRSVVVGGQSNSVSGDDSIIFGGSTNTISGNNNFILGRNNIISGYSDNTTIGVNNNIINSETFTVGNNAQTHNDNSFVFSSGVFSTTKGSAQTTTVILRKTSSGAGSFPLYIDGDGATKTLQLNTETTVFFRAHIVARRTDSFDESAAYIIEGCADTQAATGSIALVGVPTKTVVAEDDVSYDINVSVNPVDDSIVFTATGVALKTIRWVAKVELVEVTN